MTINNLPNYQWMGYLLIIITILVFLPNKYIKNPKKIFTLLGSMTVIGLLYPATKIAQYFLIGPAWFRGYFADIGFIPFSTLFLFHIVTLLKPGERKSSDSEETFISTLNTFKILTFIVATFSMGFEVLQITWLATFGPNISGIKGFTGRGDILDLVIFAFIFFFQVLYIDLEKKKIPKIFKKIRDYENTADKLKSKMT